MRPDPLQLPETAGAEPPRRAGAGEAIFDLVIAAFVIGLLLGLVVGRASASRSASVIPAASSRAMVGELDPTRPEAPNRSDASPSLAPAVVMATSGPSSGPTSTPGIRFGIASWYDAGAGLYAALPGPWRAGRHVLVCGPDRSCLSLPVVTSCGCPGGRLIDLSADAFRRFAPLSAGLVRVSVEVLGGR